MTKESRTTHDENNSCYASSVYSDDGSTLYASSIVDNDTASTLYASSVYSMEISNKPLSIEDLQQLRIVVVGLAAPKISKAVVHQSLLSVRTLLSNQDLKNIHPFVEQFRIIKSYVDLTNLDASLRLQGYKGEPLLKKSIFCSHAPQMLDQRKILLENYFRQVIDSYQHHLSLLLDFFNTNKEIEQRKYDSTKEGYLLRKEGTKLFGKWVAQYFVLKDNTLNYFNQKGGKQVGSIPLKDMSIGSQSTRYLETTDYRHGLVIKQLLNRHGDDGHMLCAINDEDRDLWVSVLSEAARKLDGPPIVAVPTFLSKLSNKKNF